MKASAIKQVTFVTVCCACFLLIILQELKNSIQDNVDVDQSEFANEEPRNWPLDSKSAGQHWRPVKGWPESTISKFRPSLLIESKPIEASLNGAKFKAELRSKRLLNLNNVSYTIRPDWLSQWQQLEPNDASQRLLVVVNSAWSNFERRQRLRSTWLNDESHLAQTKLNSAGIKLASIRHVIVVGRPSEAASQRRILEEAHQFGDMLQVNLEENYRKLSLKHLAIIKWLANIDNEAQQLKSSEKSSKLIVLKCDDDAQIDLSQLLSFYSSRLLDIQASENKRRRLLVEHDNWILCARFPEHTRVLRNPSRKWRLSKQEYQFDTFPAYCSGLAYLAPVRLLARLLKVAYEVLRAPSGSGADFIEPLWVDDVFVTGILVASLAEQPQVMKANGHFCYTEAQQSMWRRLNVTCMISETQASK